MLNNKVFETCPDVPGLVIKETGELIPCDEPVFILRACDSQAASTIRVYQSLMAPRSENWKTTQSVLDDFTQFRKENPERMQSPEEAY